METTVKASKTGFVRLKRDDIAKEKMTAIGLQDTAISIFLKNTENYILIAIIPQPEWLASFILMRRHFFDGYPKFSAQSNQQSQTPAIPLILLLEK